MMRSRRNAFTLAEIAVSIGIATVIMGGLTASMVVASRALPNPQSKLSTTIDAYHATELIATDLACAESITQRSTTAITFTVADRNADLLPETISYAWSGVVGDPIIRRYNADPPMTIADNVSVLTLVYDVEAVSGGAVPRVLLVVSNTAPLRAQDTERKTTFESWGFPVTLISQSDSQANFDSAATGADVAYISAKVTSLQLNTKLSDTPIGVVSEEGSLNDEFGVATAVLPVTNSAIWIADNGHEITAGFPIGALTICGKAEKLLSLSGTRAIGLRALAQRVINTDETLVVMNVGALRIDGTPSPGRRVVLPWGGTEFSFWSLNSNGKVLLRRSIQWASAPGVIKAVRISLQLGTDPESSVETQIPLLNEPDARRS